MTNYSDVIDGLHTRFATVSGIHALLKYEPTAIHRPPTLYSLLVSFTEQQQGQLNVRTYRILHRLCFAWQDNEKAEEQLMPFVSSIPLSVEQDPRLGGRLAPPNTQSGWAMIEECRAGFVRIDGTIYRSLDFFSTVIVKRPIERSV